MEGDPAHGIIADGAGRHHQLDEPGQVDPVGAVALEVDALPMEQLDRVKGVRALGGVKVVEVELPNEAKEVVEGVGEGEANLDLARAASSAFALTPARPTLTCGGNGYPCSGKTSPCQPPKRGGKKREKKEKKLKK